MANASHTGSASGNVSTSTVGPSSASGSGSYPKKKTSTEKEIVQSRLELASALSHIGYRSYDKAAQSFLKIGAVKELGDWIGKVSGGVTFLNLSSCTELRWKLITPSDIAIFGTLCALASMTRGAIKSQLLENTVFGLYIEQEPYIRELLEAYISSNFKTVLELLSKYSVCRCSLPVPYIFGPHTQTNLDPPLYWCAPISTCQWTCNYDQEQRCCAILPALLIYHSTFFVLSQHIQSSLDATLFSLIGWVRFLGGQ